MKDNFILNKINAYRSLSFEERTKLNAKISIVWNTVLGIAKFILSIFFGVFFIVAGIINILSSAAKAECYFGMNNNKGRSFKIRNMIISILVFLSGLQYSFYMATLLWGRTTTNYGEIISIIIALVAFIEMTVAIIGLFKVTSKGHYYRNIKIINFCSAMTAIVLTEISLISFAADGDYTLLNSIFGISVGIIIMILGIYINFAPKFSIVDKEYNVYKLVDESKLSNQELNNEIIIVELYYSYWYGGYSYKAINKNGIIEGHIIKTKHSMWTMKIWWLIIVITLSEILIFPYGIGAIVHYIKCIGIIDNLDKIMLENGFEKVNNESKI